MAVITRTSRHYLVDLRTSLTVPLGSLLLKGLVPTSLLLPDAKHSRTYSTHLEGEIQKAWEHSGPRWG